MDYWTVLSEASEYLVLALRRRELFATEKSDGVAFSWSREIRKCWSRRYFFCETVL